MAFSAFGILFARFSFTFLLKMSVAPEGLAQDRSVLHVLGQPKPRSDISFTFSELEFKGLGSGHWPCLRWTSLKSSIPETNCGYVDVDSRGQTYEQTIVTPPFFSVLLLMEDLDSWLCQDTHSHQPVHFQIYEQLLFFFIYLFKATFKSYPLPKLCACGDMLNRSSSSRLRTPKLPTCRCLHRS